MRQNSDRRAEKERHQIERIDTQDTRLEIERGGRGDDQIERAEKIPCHRPFESIRTVARHHQRYHRREDSSYGIPNSGRPAEAGRQNSISEEGEYEHDAGDAIGLNGNEPSAGHRGIDRGEAGESFATCFDRAISRRGRPAWRIL